MRHTVKGIYMKFRGSGSISDVLYENVLIDEPEQWRHLRFARCALTRVEMADDEAQPRES